MRTSRSVTSQLRRDAFALMKRCFTTLLTAGLLLGLLTMITDVVDVLGDRAGQRAYNEVMDAFHKDNPHPSDEEIQAFQAYLQSDSIQISDELRPVSEHLADEYFMISDAKLARSGAELVWKIAAFALYLLFLSLHGVICVTLFRALLAAQYGEDCTPRLVFAWGHRPQTAVWLQYSMLLRLTLWGILGLFVSQVLENYFSTVGAVIGLAILLMLILAAYFRYALAPVILAADEKGRSAGACISESANAMNEFGFIATLRVIWPALAVLAAGVGLDAVILFTALPDGLSILLNFAIITAAVVLFCPALTVIYSHMRGTLKNSSHTTFEGLRNARLQKEADEE